MSETTTALLDPTHDLAAIDPTVYTLLGDLDSQLRGAELGVPVREAHAVGHLAVSGQVEQGAEIAGRPAEAMAAEAAAELWRMTTPFNAENDLVYGSPEARLQAAETVRGVARQAQLTNRYLNSAHKRAAQEVKAGKLTQAEYEQIAGEAAATMALTNPAKLAQLNEAQRAAFARRQKAGAIPADAQFVEITSHKTQSGLVELGGIDAVVAQAVGIKTQAELARHGLNLKQEYYKNTDALSKAQARHERRQALLAAAEAEHVDRTFRMIIEEDAKRAKAQAE